MNGKYNPPKGSAQRYAVDGDIDALRRVLENDRDLVNKKDEAGMYPIHAAVASQKVEAVELLLQYGADPNVVLLVGDHEIRPLNFETGNKQIEEILVRYGATRGQRPIKVGVLRQDDADDLIRAHGNRLKINMLASDGDFEGVRDLLVKDNDLISSRDMRDGYVGFTPLHHAARRGHKARPQGIS